MTETTDSLFLFKTIYRQTPVSTQIFTTDGETVMVNKAWEKLWNVKFEQLGSYNILQDQQLVATGTMEYIKRGFKGEQVDLPVIRYDPSQTVAIKGARERWLAARIYPIKNNKGKITHLVLQHEDVTDKKNNEDTLYRLAAIIESSYDAIISKNLEGIITSWNKGAERLFGYTAGEIIGKHITTIIPKELRKEEAEIISKIKRGIPIKHYETVRVKKDGNYVEVSLSISPIKNNDGVIMGASKIARDISYQKKAEAAIRESEERLRLALDAGQIGVWDWDIEKNTLTWTDNVYKIHGVNRKNFEITFENFKNLIHPDDVNRVLKLIEKSLLKEAEFAVDFRIITPKGDLKWVTTQAEISHNKNGKPVRMLGATSDTTRQKQIEQEKSDFISMASHELKTPITGMKMFVELLSRELAKTSLEKPIHFANRIMEQTDKLTELTNDLLDVTRIETGKLQLKKEAFNISHLIQETLDTLQPTTTHTLHFKNSKIVGVAADRYRIYQVLVNLITNAIKYSPQGNKVEISLRTTASEAIIGIKDDGIGIAKNKQDKIFERLYQVTDPKLKTYPGLGLGLYITKEIVERHNGKLWLKSEHGKGSTFYFSLSLNKN